MNRSLRVHWAVSPMAAAALLVALLMVVISWPADAASTEVVRSVPRGIGAVALTFDDGWGATSCETIGKTLRRADAKATFFINGNYLKADPARWRKILKGMPVGNHTRSHPNLVNESDRVTRKQIKQNENLHERLLGREMIKVFRPPYGAYDDHVLRVAGDMGYHHVVLWNVSAADTSPDATVETIVRRTTGARPGSIILMHCAREITALALPQVIAHYQERGIDLVGLDELLGMIPRTRSTVRNKSDDSGGDSGTQPPRMVAGLEQYMSRVLTDMLSIVESGAAY